MNVHVVTGGAGFIGSNLLATLEAAGLGPLAAVDRCDNAHKIRNIAKRRLAEHYRQGLCDLDDLAVVSEPAETRSIYWLNAVLVPDTGARDDVLAQAHAAGLLARPAWKLMHHLPMYRDCPRSSLATAEMLAARIVCLPSSACLAPTGPAS